MAETQTRAGARSPPPRQALSRSFKRLQITMAGTHRREPAAKGSTVASATAEPPIDCKSQWQGHINESRRPKASTAASAAAEPSIDCKSHWQEPTPSRLALQQSLLKTPNHNGRDTQTRAGGRRGPPRQAPQHTHASTGGAQGGGGHDC